MNNALLKKEARNTYRLLQAQQSVIKKAHAFIKELTEKPHSGDIKPAKAQEITQYAQLAIARCENVHVFIQHMLDLTFASQHTQYGTTAQSLQQEIDLCFHECKSLHTIVTPLPAITKENATLFGTLVSALSEQQSAIAELMAQLEPSCE